MGPGHALPDVILVGGGIMSLATAYYLAQEGARCRIVEREALGCAASGAAAGLLAPLAEHAAHPALEHLGLQGLRLHRKLAQELPEASGIDYHFSPIPILRPAFSEAETAQLEAILHHQQGLGLDVRWLSDGDLRGLDTPLAPEVHGVLLSQEEAQVEPYRLVLAFAQALERRGGEVIHATVTGLSRQRDRATGVSLASGEALEGDVVVLCLGPWSRETQQWTGASVPVQPLKGQLVRLQPPAPFADYAIFHGGNYVLPKPGGYVVAGTTEEWVGFDTQVTPEARDGIIREALRLAPSLADASLIGAHACLRPRSADDLPILGPVPGWRNLFIATGHGRKGIMLSAITGRIMADLVLHGHTELFDITPFLPHRFA